VDCIKLLLRNEADMNKLDQDKNDYLLALASDDPELKQLLTR
jgi:hypothetical protein